jgi:hypothetical protein
VRVVPWETDEPLWRIHRAENPALWYGPAVGETPRGRFDAPDAEYRICYLGGSPAAAFVETMLRGRRHRLITRATLQARVITRVDALRPLRLAQLDGIGLAMMGVGGDTVHDADYAASRRLALAAFRRDPRIDGLRYRSRWDDDCFCVAVFDRAGGAVNAKPEGERLDRAAVIRTSIERYRVGIV